MIDCRFSDVTSRDTAIRSTGTSLLSDGADGVDVAGEYSNHLAIHCDGDPLGANGENRAADRAVRGLNP